MTIESSPLPRLRVRRARALAALVGPAASLVLAQVLSPHPASTATAAGAAAAPKVAPATLAETGLYSGPDAQAVAPSHLGFAPQYPLWTDGSEKRRWIALPPGISIDAADADAWNFPAGTRLWKEFSWGGRKVETRYMERLADGSWLFATYGWNEEGTRAELVPAKGRVSAHEFGSGRSHRIPGVSDCMACHLSAPSPVLGFTARQLDPDTPETRLPVTLDALVATGHVTGLDMKRIAARPEAATDTERRALGYLHGNCSHCHNDRGPLAKLGMLMFQPAFGPDSAVTDTLLWEPLRSPPPGLAPGTVHRVAPGAPELSAIPQRMAARQPALQMPPLGTEIADAEAIAIINRWIAEAEMDSAQAQPTEGRKLR